MKKSANFLSWIGFCIFLISFAGFIMSGCGADYGRVKVDDKSIEVEAGKDSDGKKRSKDDKCPPGHRMKGWCD